MSPEDLRRLFPNASTSTIKRNAQAGGEARNAEPEPVVRHEPVGKKPREEKVSTRFHVRLTSFRSRLIDPDNICPKYAIDCCRYCGWLPDDSAKYMTFEVKQEKVPKGEERTEIEITSISET